MKESLDSVVICFAGRIASGKSLLANAIALLLEIPYVSFGEYVRYEVRRMGLDAQDRRVLQQLGAILAEHPREFCTQVLKRVAYQPGQQLVVDGIRHKQIFEELRFHVAPSELVLLYVNAEEATISHRLREERKSETDIKQLEQDSTEKQVSTLLKKLADYTVDNGFNRPPIEAVRDILKWLQPYAPKLLIAECLTDEQRLNDAIITAQNMQARFEASKEQPRIPGLNAGEMWISEDFDAPLPDSFWLGEEATDPTETGIL